MLSYGSELYLTSKIYGASRTAVKENIASVTGVRRGSENNMPMTF